MRVHRCHWKRNCPVTATATHYQSKAVCDLLPYAKSVTANSVWVLVDKWSVILHIAVLSDQLAALWWMLTWCAVFERPWEIKCFSCLGVGVAPCHLVPAQH